MIDVPTEALEDNELKRIIQTAVTPRPIAWISTSSGDRVNNLAPYSSYNYVSTRPPVLMFTSPIGEDGTLKDTVRNAIDSEEFVVNVVTDGHASQMDRTSAQLDPDESEFEFAAVPSADCERVTPPRVADAPICMECVLYDTHRVYQKILVFGEVVQIHLTDDVLTDGKIDSEKVTTIGRLGGPYYTRGEPIDLERQY